MRYNAVMITKIYPIQLNLNGTAFQDYNKSGMLFFDIETTGLSARSSSLYLIGAVSYAPSGWQITQWFAETPSEEDQVLAAFLAFARKFSQVIHFNGDRFDIPYLQEKCRAYQLADTFSTLVSRDLYRMLRPLKNLLSLPALKQKSLEEFLDIRREDQYSGGELIDIYHQYASVPSKDSLRLLLLHNYEDLLGMLSILPLLSSLPVLNGSFGVAGGHAAGDSLIIETWYPAKLPKPFSYRGEHFYLTGENTRLAFQIHGIRGSLKHFFPDYKNYYYLPLEDIAIHKSIAAYVDKDYREPATAATCFTKKEGFFLPQNDILFEPVFKEAYKDKVSYFQCTEKFLQDKEQMLRYLRHLVSAI